MATNINLPTINIGGTSTTGADNEILQIIQDGPTAPFPPSAGDPTRPFYSPDVITPEQYFAGPVDFYRQTLGTGISVTDPTEEEEREDTSPNIFEPIGGGADQPENILQQTFGGTYNPSANNFSYGVQDVNDDVIGELTGVNFADMTPSGINAGFNAATTALTDSQRASLGSFATSKAEVEKSLGFGSMIEGAFKSLQGTAKQIDTAMKSGNLSTQIDAMLGTPTAAKPFGTGVSAVGLPNALGLMPPVAPFMGLAAGFGALNRSQQAQNAAAYKATGGTGGALMSINGMSVSRAPGSFQYGGVLPSGWSTKNIQAFEAVVNGYIPGTLTEEVYNKEKGIYEKNWQRDLISGEDILNSKGTFNQNGYWTDVTGQTYGGTIAKQTDSYTDALNAAITGAITAAGGTKGATTNISFTKQEILDLAAKRRAMGSTTDVTLQDMINAEARNKIEAAYGIGALRAGDNKARIYSRGGQFTGVASTSPTADYTSFKDYYGEEMDGSDVTDTPSTPSTPSAPAASAQVDSFNERPGWGDNTNDGPADSGSNNQGSRDGIGSDPDGPDWAMGGRIDMRNGGEAGFAQRPEFVGGNQTQPDGVSVADDQPRDVQEGTFVINSAAADFAGREDIEKMLRDAYKKVGDAGQSGVSQEVAINVSKGEVMIPPHIAKVIGYDRLNKINNRGKKEIARRQEAAGGGFIDRKKFAAGDVVLPKSKPKRVNQAALGDVELRADMEEFIQTDPLARLGWNLYEKGDLDIKAIVLPSKKEVQVNVAGVYTPRSERRDPGRVSRQFEGFAEKQGITKQNRKVAGVHYITGENVNYGRSDATLTLLHELRHHAMRHLNKKYKIPLPKLSREEAIFDAQDHANRIQARKVKPSIPREAKEKNLEITQRHMYMSPSANKEMATYQSVAEEVLKDRKVPPRTKSKEVEGFFTRAMGLLGL